jgi:transcriptional regulator with XRE-family HTH domain
VRAARRARGWSQAELASWLGVSRPTVTGLEKGRGVALPTAMRALALLGQKVVIAPKGARLHDDTGPGR